MAHHGRGGRGLSESGEPARAYHRWQFRLSAVGVVLALGYLSGLLATGLALRLRDALAGLTSIWWLELPLALLIIGGGYRLLTLPLAWLQGFWLPRRFGLLHQPFRQWAWDALKAHLIGGLLGVLAAEVVYGLLRATPWWWLWGALCFLGGHAVLAVVAPVWLVPLFYRLTPLPDGGLRDRLLGLAGRAGVPVLDVWVADHSRKSRAANAAVLGLAGTRRILLFDTLVDTFTADEVETVLAHELAHQVHGDIVRGLFFQGTLTLVTFWAAEHLLRTGTRMLGLTGPADLAGLPLFGLILMVLGAAALPLGNGWSRRVERQADDFALRMTGNAGAFIAAMERLAALNLAESDPHPLKEIIFYSHPSIGRRVARAQSLLRQPA